MSVEDSTLSCQDVVNDEKQNFTEIDHGDGGGLSCLTGLQHLQQYLEEGKLNHEKVDYYKNMYKKLYECVVSTYSREKELFKKTKQMNNDLLGEKIKYEKLCLQKNEEFMLTTHLEKEKEKAMKEVAERIENDNVLNTELVEFQQEHETLMEHRDHLVQDNANLVEPEIQKITDEIQHLTEDCRRLNLTIKQETQRKQDYLEKTNDFKIKQELLQVQQSDVIQNLNKMKSEPERIKRQGDLVLNAVENLEKDERRLQERIDECDKIIAAQTKTKKDCEEISKELHHKLELQRETTEQREREVDQVRAHLEEGKVMHHIRITRKLELELERKQVIEQLRFSTDTLSNYRRDFDHFKKILKKKLMALETSKNSIPNLKMQWNEVLHQLQLQKHDNQQLQLRQQELAQEKLVWSLKFSKLEGLENETKEEIKSLSEKVKEQEGMLIQWMAEDVKQSKIVSMLSSQRETRAREASKALKNEKETMQEVKMKELVILELTKRSSEIQHRLKEFSSLYDVVKHERNKYVNLIQGCSQSLAEMKEKIKILQNEVEILRNESLAKEKALSKEHLSHQNAQSHRDTLRLDTNKLQAHYKLKQEQMEHQITEIDQINILINMTEKEMLRLKKKYEMAVEARNLTGVELIDRNDELCILYEKSNLQEKTLQHGEISIRNLESEIQMHQLQFNEIQRQIEVKRKQIPKLPEYTTKILQLQQELNMEKEMTEMLCRDLETPKNHDRWRELEGEDPDFEQLKGKLQLLELRLHSKKDQLLEKDIVLEEITHLADQLKIQANEGKKDTLQLSKKVNEFQTKIKQTTTKMMATVSELSMYQATAFKLQQEKQQQQGQLDQAQAKLQLGETPTEQALQEWKRIERERLRIEDLKIHNYNKLRHIAATGATQNSKLSYLRTTAEVRPNAYIPDDLGIPKPYGGEIQPFKPSLSGSTMRHIRKPEIKDIEI